MLKGVLRHSSRSDGDHETLSHTSWPVITPLLLSPQVAVTVYLNTQRRCSLNSCRALTICPVLPAGIRACLPLVCASISHRSCLNLTLHFNPPHLHLSVGKKRSQIWVKIGFKNAICNAGTLQFNYFLFYLFTHFFHYLLKDTLAHSLDLILISFPFFSLLFCNLYNLVYCTLPYL